MPGIFTIPIHVIFVCFTWKYFFGKCEDPSIYISCPISCQCVNNVLVVSNLNVINGLLHSIQLCLNTLEWSITGINKGVK